MSSFRREDYEHLFKLGRELYLNHNDKARVREIATQLMAMSESTIGQQAPWPCIHKRYRHLTTYFGAKISAQLPPADIQHPTKGTPR